MVEGAKIYNSTDARVLSSHREFSRGGIDAGLYFLGLRNSPKKMLKPNKNYNEANYTNVLIDMRKVVPGNGMRVDWHDHIPEEAINKAIAQVESTAQRQRSEDDFKFDPKYFPTMNHDWWPKEINLDYDKWQLMHQHEVDMKVILEDPNSCLGTSKGISLPVPTMRIFQQTWTLAMSRSATEMCVWEGKALKPVRYADDTAGASQKPKAVKYRPLLLHSGRGLPLPMGIEVERSQMGGIVTSNRSSGILDLNTKAAVLLT